MVPNSPMLFTQLSQLHHTTFTVSNSWICFQTALYHSHKFTQLQHTTLTVSNTCIWFQTALCYSHNFHSYSTQLSQCLTTVYGFTQSCITHTTFTSYSTQPSQCTTTVHGFNYVIWLSQLHHTIFKMSVYCAWFQTTLYHRTFTATSQFSQCLTTAHSSQQSCVTQLTQTHTQLHHTTITVHHTSFTVFNYCTWFQTALCYTTFTVTPHNFHSYITQLSSHNFHRVQQLHMVPNSPMSHNFHSYITQLSQCQTTVHKLQQPTATKKELTIWFQTAICHRTFAAPIYCT